jgi:hypothetical protein
MGAVAGNQTRTECDRPRFAEVARYSKPQGSTKVTGPSIRFVEAALRCLGNIATYLTLINTLADEVQSAEGGQA